jgi:hypothetical protein
VDIVPAGVHDIRGERGVVRARLLLHRQRVHIAAQDDTLARPCALDGGDDARAARRRQCLDAGDFQCIGIHVERSPVAADIRPEGDTRLFEILRDEMGGVRLVQREFRVHVQIAPLPAHALRQ